MKLYSAFVVLGLLACSSNAVAKCTAATAIWANETDGVRHIVYGTSGVDWGSDVYLEEWRKGKLAWRSKARTVFSNGAVIWHLVVENESGLSGDEAMTDAIMERIDQDDDGIPDWLVFAALGQQLHYAGGLKVEWFNGFRPKALETIEPPSQYKFIGCRNTAELVLYPPHGTRYPPTYGTVYASPEVCENYQATGQLTSPENTKPFNDGIWWMDDVRISGWELECKITKKGKAEIAADCGFEDADAPASAVVYKFKEIGRSRQIGPQLLVECPAKE